MTSMDFLFFFVAQDFVIDEALDMDLERYLGDGKMWVGVRTSLMWGGGKGGGGCKRGDSTDILLIYFVIYVSQSNHY